MGRPLPGHVSDPSLDPEEHRRLYGVDYPTLCLCEARFRASLKKQELCTYYPHLFGDYIQYLYSGKYVCSTNSVGSRALRTRYCKWTELCAQVCIVSLIQFGPNLSSKAADWQGTILVDGTHVPAVVRHNRASVEKHENKNTLHSYKIKVKSYNVFVFLCEPTCQVLHCEAVPGNCPDREAFVSLSGRTRAAHYGAALLGDDGFCGSAWEVEGGADIRRRWTIEVVNRRLKAFATFKQASVNIVDYYLQLQVVCWLVNEDMLVHPMRRVEEVDFKVCCFFYVCIFHVFFQLQSEHKSSSLFDTTFSYFNLHPVYIQSGDFITLDEFIAAARPDEELPELSEGELELGRCSPVPQKKKQKIAPGKSSKTQQVGKSSSSQEATRQQNFAARERRRLSQAQ